MSKKAKFKVGQVVAIKRRFNPRLTHPIFNRVEDHEHDLIYLYRLSETGLLHAEIELRTLTKKERGQ